MDSKMIIYLLVIVMGMACKSCICQSGNDVKDLLKELFTTNDYNKKVRPLNDQTEPVHVDVDLVLKGINDFNEVAEKLTTTGFLSVSWTDDYLKWNSTAKNNIDTIFVPQGDIWKPDIALQNGFQKLNELGSDFLYVEVSNTGVVNWNPFEVFTSKCNVNIKYFPFDKQTCDLKFVVWSYTLLEVNITKLNNDVDTYEMETNGEWSIIGSFVTDEATSVEATVIFSLIMQRKALFYVLNIIIPIVMLSILNVFVFVLPMESGEKTSFGITVFLAFAVFLTIVSSILPQNSESVSLLSIYLIIQTIQSTLILIATVIQLRIAHRDDSRSMGSCLVSMVKVINAIQCRSHRAIGTQSEENKYETTDLEQPSATGAKLTPSNQHSVDDYKITWKCVCESLDFIFFCFFTLSIFLTSTITLGIASNNG